MKLLFVTRKLDPKDPRVGFMMSWISSFSHEVDALAILTWQRSNVSGLSQNVRLVSADTDIIGKVRGAVRFFTLANRCAREADGIFVHMMPVYAILIGPIIRLRRKTMLLWYTHKHVDWKLRLAVWFASAAVTASSESFRLKTKKPVHIIGHGIDADFFRPDENRTPRTAEQSFNILSLGRISPAKQLETIIEAVNSLAKHRTFREIVLKIVGAPALPSDEMYLESLKRRSREMGLESRVSFIGGVPHDKTRDFYRWAHVVVNLSKTGSLDKAVLEAMACGTLVISSNEAFREIFRGEAGMLFLENPNSESLAERITALLRIDSEQRRNIKKFLREEVLAHHTIQGLAKKVVNLFKVGI